MKVLIAAGLYPPESGGPATYAKLIEERLPKLGIDVEVVKFRDVRHLPPGVRHVTYFLNCWERSAGCDVIYAQDTISVGLPAALAAIVSGKKFMVRVPGDYAWEQARQRFGVKDELDEFQTKKYGWRVEWLRSLQKFVVDRVNIVIVPSDYMKRIVGKWTDPTKVHRIYSSIEVPATREIERPDGFLVVSSGRRVPWKHFDAIERVVGKEKDWKFFLAENLPRAEALGWVKEADVYALNSTYEGLSHALVEAMMLGTPIVATNVGGNPELIDDGKTGLLVPAKNDDALHAALKKVHDDPAAARARAEAAKEKVKEFSIETAVGNLVELLKTI